MKFSELIEKVRGHGVLVAEIRTQSDPEIHGVCEDSRKARPGDLFIARTGTKTTGTQFIDEAFAKGAVAVVLQEDAGIPCAVAWARVANVNLACALLAHEVAGNPTAGMRVIGITGTKGKTTVAYLLRSVLKAAGHKVGMIGTVEIDDGEKTTPADMTTPGSVELVELFKKMRANGATHCVMEVSSHALHQHRVAGIDFAVAIFTNLTGDHLDYHKTMEEYAAAKAQLFEGLKENALAIVNSDDKWVQRVVSGCTVKILNYAIEKSLALNLGPGMQKNNVSDWVGEMIQMSNQGMNLQVIGPWWSGKNKNLQTGRLPVKTDLVGRHNVYNLLSVIAAASACHVNFITIMHAIEDNSGVPGRLQAVVPDGLTRVELPFQIFVDYAHTHDSLENVLSTLRTTMVGGANNKANPSRDRPGATSVVANAHGSLPDGRGSETSPQLICLFGCGGDRDRTKRPKMAAIAERLADQVIVTSDNPRTENPAAIIQEICTGFSPNWQSAGKVTIEPDRRTAIRAAIAAAQPGDVVLLAGKGHENYQIIGTTKHHFDDVEEAENALRELNPKHDNNKT